MIHDYEDLKPDCGKANFIAWNAEVMGDVTMEAGTSAWFNVSIRGDIQPVKIGKGSNVQENAVLHVGEEEPCLVGENVTIGHGAIVHGCTIKDNCLIGMGAIILDRAVIGEGSIVGAGALVTPGKSYPPGSMILGSPATAIRQLSDDEKQKIIANAVLYQELANKAKASGGESPGKQR